MRTRFKKTLLSQIEKFNEKNNKEEQEQESNNNNNTNDDDNNTERQKKPKKQRSKQLESGKVGEIHARAEQNKIAPNKKNLDTEVSSVSDLAKLSNPLSPTPSPNPSTAHPPPSSFPSSLWTPHPPTPPPLPHFGSSCPHSVLWSWPGDPNSLAAIPHPSRHIVAGEALHVKWKLITFSCFHYE